MSRKRKASTISITEPKASAIGSILHPTIRDFDDKVGISSDMDTQGFCVIGNILSSEEKIEFEDGFWNAIQKRDHKLRRDDQSTWIEGGSRWKGNGQFKWYGMAQEAHTWLIRSNFKIKHVFEKILFEEDCCVSLDGAAANFSEGETKLKMHVDLVPGVPGFDTGSIQGSYNLFEVAVEEGSGKVGAGFVCVPGSHLLYDQMWEERMKQPGFEVPKKHWHELEADHPLQQAARIVISPANSLVIWDAKLLHKNYGGDLSVQELGRLCRLTQFVSWQPKKYRTAATLVKKRQLVLQGKAGNHWASEAITVPLKPFPPWGQHVNTVIPFEGATEVPPELDCLL